jgi:hypothetical protein
VAKLMRHYRRVGPGRRGRQPGRDHHRSDIALGVVAEARDRHRTYAGEIATADPRAAGPGESLEEA